MLVGLALGASPTSAGDSNLVKVPLDVDIHDKPADESTKRPQFLKGGTEFILMQKTRMTGVRLLRRMSPFTEALVGFGAAWAMTGRIRL
jgi:hypothetical protein